MARLESRASRYRATAGKPSRKAARRFWTDTGGATAIEYGLIAGLTFLVIAGTLGVYADRMSAMYTLIGNSLGRAF